MGPQAGNTGWVDVTRRPSWKRPLRSTWRPLTPPKHLSPVRRAPGRSVGVRCCGDRGQGWPAVVTGDHRNEEILSGLSFPKVTRAGLGLAQMGLVPSILLYMGSDLLYRVQSWATHSFGASLLPTGALKAMLDLPLLVRLWSSQSLLETAVRDGVTHAMPASQATPSGQATPLQSGHDPLARSQPLQPKREDLDVQ